MEKGPGIESGISKQISSVPATVKEVIRNPVGFFSDMPRRGGFVEPIVFLAVMGVVVGALQVILSALGLGMAGTFPGSLAAVFLTPIFMIIGSFVGGFILYCIWNVMKSRETFETAYRCGAYCSAISPITTILNVIPYAGAVLGLAWTVYLLIVASIEVHNLEPKLAWIVFGVIFVILSVAAVRF
jgi:hypothetical protein